MKTSKYFVIVGFLLTTFVASAQIEVTNNNSSGAGSLRQAIIDANANIGPDDIIFNISLKGETIPTDAPFILTDDGTVIYGDIDGDKLPDITLDAGNSMTGVIIVQSKDNQIFGLNIIDNITGAGILIEGIAATNNIIGACFIGTTQDGLTGGGAGVACNYGVRITNQASLNIVGHMPAGYNVFSGNTNGVYIDDLATNNQIIYSILGLDILGTSVIPNQYGIFSPNNVGNNNTIGMEGAGNIISGNQVSGVQFRGGTGHSIIGNLIGTDISGSAALANQHGIRIENPSSSNIIGNANPGGGNVISGNDQNGIEIITSSNNIIQGNVIGLGSDGTTIIPNGWYGVEIAWTSTDNTIGGDRPSGEGNVLSGNARSGIKISLASATNNIHGNIIGLDQTGTIVKPNSEYGVELSNDAQNNVIGDGSESLANIISGNTLSGIYLAGANVIGNAINYNYIGTNPTGDNLGNIIDGVRLDASATGNSIPQNIIAYNQYGIYATGPTTQFNLWTQNSIYGNTISGISLVSGAQQNISSPVITSVPFNGMITGTATAGAFIDVYADSGDQGEYLFGVATADAGGDWTCTCLGDLSSIPGGLNNITAVQTDGTNSSEFSILYVIPAAPSVSYTSVPAANANNIPINSDITLDFDVDIDLLSVHNNSTNANEVYDDNIVIVGNQSGQVQGTFAIGGDNSVIVFNPSSSFKAGEKITVTVSSAVLGTGGEVAFARSFSFIAASGPFEGAFLEKSGTGIVGITYGATAYGDYDNDGDIDLIVVGWDDPSYDETAKIYNNDNGVFTDISAGLTGVYYSDADWGDYDTDGDLDLIIAGGSSALGLSVATIYRNDGGGTFVDITAGLQGVDYSSVDWGDFDNDGDLDVVVTGRYNNGSDLASSTIYRNDGSDSFTDIGAGLIGLLNGSADWGDFDADGDLDLLITGFDDGQTNRHSIIYRNDDGSFVDASAGLPGVGYSATDWGDYDNDGDLDIVIMGGQTSPTNDGVYIYQNNAGIFTDINAGFSDSFEDGSTQWADFDGDGDLDLALTGQDFEVGEYVARIYRNDAGVFTNIIANLRGVAEQSTGNWGDFDGDGDLDLLITGVDNLDFNPSARIYENTVPPFITTWVTTDGQITIPTTGAGYDYSISWTNLSTPGDGTDGSIGSVTGNNTITDLTNGDTYQVSIWGTFPRIYFNNVFSYRTKIKSLEQWGTNPWQDFTNAFMGCNQMVINATDIPDLSGVNSLSHMFGGVNNVNAFTNTDLSGWNTSNITDMSFLFDNAYTFNLNVNAWDVSNVTNMDNLFNGTAAFNQPLNNWVVSAATNMSSMFYESGFNQPIDNWDVSSVDSFFLMFGSNSVFNQPLNNWDVSGASNLSYMFNYTDAYNQPLNNWNVANVADMSVMFEGAAAFDQSLGEWDISNVTDMSFMLDDAGLSTANYDATLIGWADDNGGTETIPLTISLDANILTYCSGASAHATLLAGPYNWTITDAGSLCPEINVFAGIDNTGTAIMDAQAGAIDVGSAVQLNNITQTFAIENTGGNILNISDIIVSGTDYTITNAIATILAGSTETFTVTLSGASTGTFNTTITIINDDPDEDPFTFPITGTILPPPFITTWTTADNLITIPVFGGESYNYDIYWEEIEDPTHNGSLPGQFLNTDVTFDVGFSGNYRVEISGWFPRIYFNNSGDKDELMTIEQWGDQIWTSMESAFYGCSNLTVVATDTPDLSAATDLSYMFAGASSLNTDINSWDVSIVSNMSSMFAGASAFSQSLGGWDVSNTTMMNNMLDNSGLTIANYDVTLTAWAALASVPSSINLGAVGLNYCYGEPAHNLLTGTYSWTITDAGINCPPTTAFITTWQTDNPDGTSNDDQISIPTIGSGYNYDIYWEEVGNVTNNGNEPAGITGNYTITFPSPGIYRVVISGDFPRIYFNAASFNSDKDSEKLLTIEQWGTNPWTSMESAFSGCSNLTITASDSPNFTFVTSMAEMFYEATSMNANLNSWDVSNVTNMEYLFRETDSFDQPLDGWDVGNVTNMGYMFGFTPLFNQPLGSWDVSSVTDMRSMFAGAYSFDQPLASWDVSNVTLMHSLFSVAQSFNQDISGWVISKVTDMRSMFNGATVFNQDIGSWDISGTTRLSSLFRNAAAFNQDLSGWDVSNITDMESLFNGAAAFNQDLSGWDVSNVLDMRNMFSYTDFNANISSWDVGSVGDFNAMFSNNASFNQDISGWNVSSATDMRSMFLRAASFNQNLDTWDVQNVSLMTSMLSYSGLSVENYDNLLIGWSAMTLKSGVSLGAFGLHYCSGEAAKASIVSTFSWSITDSGQGCISVFEGLDVSGQELTNGQPNAIDFGSTAQTITKTLSFTIRNDLAISLTNLAVTISGSTEFIIPATANSISPAGTLTFDVNLMGITLGSHTETVSITSDNFVTPFVFDVTAEVTATPEPEIAVFNGSSITGDPILDGDFIGVDMGYELRGFDLSDPFTIVNIGSADLIITGLSIAGTSFSLDNSAPLTIVPDASVIVWVTLDGSISGYYSELINITSNDTDEADYDFPAGGEILGPEITGFDGPNQFSPEILNAQPTPVSMGGSNEGTDLVHQITISNFGEVDLDISSISVSGSAFTISPNIPVILDAVIDGVYTELVLNITLDGSTVGRYTETVTIDSDDDVIPSFSFNITGDIVAPPHIYWTENLGEAAGDDEIHRTDLDGNDFTQYYSGFADEISGLVIDTTANRLYWTDAAQAEIITGEIGPAGLSSGPTVLLDYNPGSAGGLYDLALDLVNGHIYFTYANAETGFINKIARVNLDGTNLTELIDLSFEEPFGLDLDLTNGKIYYTTNLTASDQDSRLYRANLDGSNVEQLYFSSTPVFAGVFLRDVKIDPINEVVYWSVGEEDVPGGQILYNSINEAAPFAAPTSFSFPGEPRGIDIDLINNKLYWMCRGANDGATPPMIMRSNLDGSNIENIFTVTLFPSSYPPGPPGSAFLALDLRGLGPILSCPTPPTAVAGVDITLCEGSTANLSGSIGGAASSLLWTTAGDGSFDDATTVNAIYSPGTTDISAGSVLLTITTDDPDGAGPCIAASDDILITIDQLPTSAAGADQNLCAAATVTLAGIIGGGATGGLWTTSGDGAFDIPTSLTANYTPSPTDITNGIITLTLTTTGNGSCTAAADQMIISITPPTASAGIDQSVCEGENITLAGSIGGSASTLSWTTSGDGSFDDINLAIALYTPGTSDNSSGTVTLTLTTDDPDGAGPCIAASDDIVISIDLLPTSAAGADQNICSANPVTLAGIIDGGATGGLWTSSGDGAFDIATSPTANYTPGPTDITNGTITLTLTTTGNGSCTAASDQMIISIIPPTASAGVDQSLCESETVTLAGSIGGAASTLTWTTSGDGNFDDVNLATALYTPGTSDISSGAVTLTITTDDPDGAGPCLAVSDITVISISPQPIITVDADFTICEGDAANLTAVIGGSASTISWSSTGDGSFNDITIATPVYSAGTADIAAGSVTLTATTDDPDGAGACIAASDDVIIIIEQAHIVDAGIDQFVCATDPVSLSGILGGSAAAGVWTTSGDGVFDNSNNLTAIYTLGTADISSSSVVLTLTSVATISCLPVSDNLAVSIAQPIAVVDQTASQNVGEASTIDVTNGATLNVGDVLTTTIDVDPLKGVAAINPDGSIEYTSNSGTVGTDSFEFTVCNQCGLCSTAQASITINNEPPVVNIPPVTGQAGGVITVDVLSGVTDVNGNIDLSSLKVIVQPTSGASASFDGDGNLLVNYDGINFIGTDQLTIEVCDVDGLCTSQIIFIEIAEPSVVVYNAISPNNDGKHDYLEIENAEFFTANKVVILNRWGDIVYEASGYDNANTRFEGVSNKGGNGELPSGTYYYQIDLGDNSPLVNGFVTLRR